MYGLDFKVIPSFPDYAVSRGGIVMRVVPRTCARFGLVKRPFYTDGYARMNLNRNQVLVHRVVAETHIGPCPAGYTVNHEDGNKVNNSISNLEYMTQRENILHARGTGLAWQSGELHNSAKLTETDVRDIRAATGGRGLVTKLAAKYGVSRSNIWGIRRRKNWKHVA